MTNSGTQPSVNWCAKVESTTICECCGGKKILEWLSSPEKTLATMIDLKNKYALNARNPNSYSGIF